ncbi:MAG: HEAT repeat domain-containing protein [Planctomycetes bacterium]|nr:HEAT repeat domain-containing protein [Planctomycetota bacterium]
MREERVFAVLAPHANREVFELLLKYPINADDYEPRQKVFVALGASLRKHPEVADLLLVTYTRPNDPGTGVARFAQEVFKHAGEPMLPILHKALQSPDRVIRSNAARACGSIGDESSIGPLIAALDLESGFSRASIVWALGELKAADALPHLATLYVDARNDEERQRGSGFRMAQAVAQVQSQFENIRSLEAIGADWDELKQTTVPEPIDPRRHERLLSPRIILDAVAKIGPAASQIFYRQMAAEPDTEARREAAIRLAEGTADDRAKNLPILRNLLGDSDMSIRTAAAVSLFLLGERDVEKQILAWLKSPDRGDWFTTIDQLGRVEDGRSLLFARDAIRKLAERVRGNSYQDERLRRVLDRIPSG